jgi:hypothetical protein
MAFSAIAGTLRSSARRPGLVWCLACAEQHSREGVVSPDQERLALEHFGDAGTRGGVRCQTSRHWSATDPIGNPSAWSGRGLSGGASSQHRVAGMISGTRLHDGALVRLGGVRGPVRRAAFLRSQRGIGRRRRRSPILVLSMIPEYLERRLTTMLPAILLAEPSRPRASLASPTLLAPAWRS